MNMKEKYFRELNSMERKNEINFRELNSPERGKIKNYLYQRFGYKLPDWKLYSLIPNKSFKMKFLRIYAFTGREIPTDLNIESLGLFIGTWEKNNFRVSLEAGEEIGRESIKNFVELNEIDIKEWFGGKNLKKKYPIGSYLLKYKNHWIGGGYSDGNEIINYLPKVFSLELERKRKKLKRRQREIKFVPQEFLEYCKKLPEFEISPFLESISRYPSKFAIRVNRLKTTSEELFKSFPSVKFLPISWAKGCFWINESERWITKSLDYLLGYFYVQEPASLVAVRALQPKPGETILDLCAAPGSKTTQVGENLSQKGVIVANDVDQQRVRILIANIQRQGLMNTIVTRGDGRELRLKEKFDKVLVDAPCTAIGTELKSISRWDMETVKRLSKLQRQLIVAGFENLKPGGIMVYSTCTITREENEDIVEFLLSRYRNQVEIESIPLEGIKFVSGFIPNTIKIYPYHNQTESFFVARLRKLS